MVKPASMNKYRVFMKGMNFQLFDQDSQKIESLGFYTKEGSGRGKSLIMILGAREVRLSELLKVSILSSDPRHQPSVK
jgi:hypothetical protein